MPGAVAGVSGESRAGSFPSLAGRVVLRGDMETFKKRQKEMRRLERQRDKAARRVERKQAHSGAAPETTSDEDASATNETSPDVEPSSDA